MSWSRSTQARWNRWCRGAQTPAWCFRSPPAFPIRTPSPRPMTAPPRNAHWSTWPSNRTPPIEDISIDRVFLGSCTNARLDDLRAAAEVIRGRKVSDSVYAMVVPGSTSVKLQAESEGLDALFKDAGFDWREAGCSMCLGMNPDILSAGERVRLHLQSQLRGTPGPRRQDAPRIARNGCCRCHNRSLRRYPRLEVVRR